MRALISAALIAVSSAQAKADAPLRHLVYEVSQHNQGTAQGASYEGTETGVVASGFDGKILVDVMAAANDGGLVIRAALWFKNEIRPLQAVTCAVYGNGNVVCPQDAPNSATVNTLFAFLGRGYYDPGSIDAKGNWDRHHQFDDGSTIDTHCSSAPTQEANVVTITQHTELNPGKQISGGLVDNATLTYNTVLDVPLAIHDVSQNGPRSSGSWSSTTDFRLVEDSFAKK